MPELASDLVLRLAAPADADGISHVHRASWRTTYAGILPLDVIAAQAGRKTAAEWMRRLASGTASECTWIAERGGAIVGFASCGAARHRLEGLEAEIYALYVLQDYQRCGVGRELVRACARHFVRQGQFGFYLWVLKANRARMFYEALGGQEVGEKTERLGQHSFAEVAYAWHDLTGLVSVG
ncbi:MAG: GNAT family N-acetyltransferase [Pseudomonadota bacterium]|nr:GNAT family N-acetyltransferase [Pseudomonadota bacterium]